jgi:hypothetical protein
MGVDLQRLQRLADEAAEAAERASRQSFWILVGSIAAQVLAVGICCLVFS